MSRAEQMPLVLSVVASVDLQADRDRAIWAAEALSAENARLREEKQADQARIKALEKDNKASERSYKRLKAERDQLYQARLSDAQHPLHQECQQLRQEVDSLRSKLFQRVWHELEAMRSPGSLGNGPSKADLLQIVKVAHPDRWSSPGASALTLANEVTVMLNALRDRVGGQA